MFHFNQQLFAWNKLIEPPIADPRSGQLSQGPWGFRTPNHGLFQVSERRHPYIGETPIAGWFIDAIYPRFLMDELDEIAILLHFDGHFSI